VSFLIFLCFVLKKEVLMNNLLWCPFLFSLMRNN